MLNLLNLELLPDWFQYPSNLVELLEEKIIDFGSWQLLHGEWLEVRHAGFKKRFPNLYLVPFARRLDDDDVACFDISCKSTFPKVKIVHDFASPGWEDRGEFDSFDAWLIGVKEEAEE
jgi:hypothetical protein